MSSLGPEKELARKLSYLWAFKNHELCQDTIKTKETAVISVRKSSKRRRLNRKKKLRLKLLQRAKMFQKESKPLTMRILRKNLRRRRVWSRF